MAVRLAAPRPPPPHRLASCKNLGDIALSTTARLAGASPERHGLPGASYGGLGINAAAGNLSPPRRGELPPDPLLVSPRGSLTHDASLWTSARGAETHDSSPGGRVGGSSLGVATLSRVAPRLTQQGLHRLEMSKILGAREVHTLNPKPLPEPGGKW